MSPAADPRDRVALSDPRARALPAPRTRHLFDIVDELDPRIDFGPGPLGRRVLFGASGGTFGGDRLRGRVMPGGGDWALFRNDGTMNADVRLTLLTDDGALLTMTYGGRLVTPPDVRAEMKATEARSTIDPARYYFRTNPLFETGAPQYGWLNDIVCIGTGYLIDGGVAYRVDEVL